MKFPQALTSDQDSNNTYFGSWNQRLHSLPNKHGYELSEYEDSYVFEQSRLNTKSNNTQRFCTSIYFQQQT